LEKSLIKSLKSLKGNPKACVYTEPLWGLSMNLCLPYASVYMLALGLNDFQVGITATIAMLSQGVFAFLSGPITDKLGRRKTTAIFDFIGWCIPCIIWWRAEGFWFFAVAATVNGIMQVTGNSWNCLLIEDVEKSKVTTVNSLIMICGQLSVFFVPISAILFSRLTLIPAIRILYINAFVVMTLKVVLLYIFSTETRMGAVRLEESRGKSLLSLASGYGPIVKIIFKSKGTVFALAVSIIVATVGLVSTTFWPVIVTQKLLIPDYHLPFFLIIRSTVAIMFFFFVVPRLTKRFLKTPLLIGFVCLFIGMGVLILTPVEGPLRYVMLCVSLLFDGFGGAFLLMLAKSLVDLYVNPKERARVQAILNMIILAATSPFGWIGGMLSGISRELPFVLNLCILTVGFFVVLIYYRKNPQPDAPVHGA